MICGQFQFTFLRGERREAHKDLQWCNGACLNIRHRHDLYPPVYICVCAAIVYGLISEAELMSCNYENGLRDFADIGSNVFKPQE